MNDRFALTAIGFLVAVGAYTVMRWAQSAADWWEEHLQRRSGNLDPGGISEGKRVELLTGGRKR